jgi:hypothetical protein
MRTLPKLRDLLAGHIALELESIDRSTLPKRLRASALTWPGLVGFLCQERGQPIASPALLGQITGKFIAEVKSFAPRQAILCFTLSVRNPKTGVPIKCAESGRADGALADFPFGGRRARSSRKDLSMLVARALKIGQIADGGLPPTYETMR